MPELPDICLYVLRLNALVASRRLRAIRLRTPFLLRSVEPALEEFDGRVLLAVERLGKRLVFGFESDLFLVLHLMIAGRLRWRAPGAGLPGKMGLAAFDFEGGSLILTEAGSKRRASLHALRGREALCAHDRGGLEVLETCLEDFAQRLASERHTLKRALCDARLFSGIGNAYSDEILFQARLSPFKRSTELDADELQRLFDAARSTLTDWSARLVAEVGEGFPDKLSAFHPKMAVHGRFRLPCPRCAAPVQRIVYARNECNYCARCQTGGKLLADRALSRLLRDDWPRSLDELDELGRP